MVFLAFASLTCTDESSPLNVVPTTPADIMRLQGFEQRDTVGTTLPDRLIIKILDRYNNPVPSVEVAFVIASGDGSVDPARTTTTVAGEASTNWTLGTKAGRDTVRAVVSGIDTVIFTAIAEPGPPASIDPLAGQDQADTVVQELPEPIVVRVTDEYGNGIPNVEVEWSPVKNSGSVRESVSTTDSAGQTSNRWTLGKEAGEQLLDVKVIERTKVISLTVTARAVPDRPEELTKKSGDQQSGPAGSKLPGPFVVEVADQYGNVVENVPINWEVLKGGGSSDPSTSRSDSLGLAKTIYTLGDLLGQQLVAAVLEGRDQVEFSVQATLPNNLTIERIYVTQSAQRLNGRVPLVADRKGLLRVFVRAESTNNYTPSVEIRLYRRGNLIESYRISNTRTSVPTRVSENPLNASWNLFLPGSRIQPDLSIVAEVDPEDDIFESDESDNLFPREGSTKVQDVRGLPTFRVLFVPIYIAETDGVGNVDDGNKDDYMHDADRMMPIPGYDAVVREAFSTSAVGGETVEEWEQMLEEIRVLRMSEGSSRYYYGVVGSSNPALCGIAYLGTPAALGSDLMELCGASTAAHEWGHNWNRLHSPCGFPRHVDPDYPYSGGSIGIYGVDVDARELKPPSGLFFGYKDIMSYCSPKWVSDYTYEGILQYRETESRSSRADAPSESSLIVWGRIGPEKLILHPSFQTVTKPVVPTEDGPYQLSGFDSEGRRIFSLSFKGKKVADLGKQHRHFAFAIPWEVSKPQRLERLRLEIPGQPATEVGRPAQIEELSTALQVRKIKPGLVQVSWNDAAFPLLVVRDRNTGNILALARDGSAVIRTRADELVVTLSAGVGTIERIVRVR